MDTMVVMAVMAVIGTVVMAAVGTVVAVIQATTIQATTIKVAVDIRWMLRESSKC